MPNDDKLRKALERLAESWDKPTGFVWTTQMAGEHAKELRAALAANPPAAASPKEAAPQEESWTTAPSATNSVAGTATDSTNCTGTNSADTWRTIIVGLPIIRKLLNAEDVSLETFKVSLIPDDVLWNNRSQPKEAAGAQQAKPGEFDAREVCEELEKLLYLQSGIELSLTDQQNIEYKFKQVYAAGAASKGAEGGTQRDAVLEEAAQAAEHWAEDSQSHSCKYHSNMIAAAIRALRLSAPAQAGGQGAD